MSIHRLAFFTILLTYILIVFGGFVASSESGMGCGPEWPLCNGAVIPELSGDTLIEFSHRVIGAILAILVGIIFFKLKRSNTAFRERKVANWMLVLFALQVSLGAIIVFLDLPISIIITHLFIAMAFLTTLLWIWRSSKLQLHTNHTSIDKSNRKSIVLHINICLILLLITLGFGAYIKHQHPHEEEQSQINHHEQQGNHHVQDGHHEQDDQLVQDGHHDHDDQLVQNDHHVQNSHQEKSHHDPTGSAFDWLFEWDSLIPLPNNWIQIVEATHLTLAVVSASYVLFLTFFSFSRGWEESIKKRLTLATIFVLSQITIGLIMAYVDIPLFWAVLHLAFGTILLIIVIETRVFLDLSEESKLEKNIQSIV